MKPMDTSAAESAAGQAEQAICDAGRRSVLGESGKDAGLFATAGHSFRVITTHSGHLWLPCQHGYSWKCASSPLSTRGGIFEGIKPLRDYLHHMARAPGSGSPMGPRSPCGPSWGDMGRFRCISPGSPPSSNNPVSGLLWTVQRSALGLRRFNNLRHHAGKVTHP